MARINDNLFTTLMRHTLPQQFHGRLMTLFGPLHAEFNDNGLCTLKFEDPETQPRTIDSAFRHAFLTWLQAFEHLSADRRWQYFAPQGTLFQNKVWQALLHLPHGTTISYKKLAAAIGQPTAVRAVASAVAANPICLLIPCHRVINTDGRYGKYRWGADRKLALLDAERSDASDLLRLFL